MIDIQAWMAEALTRLRAAFGPRLLFVGLQGSRRRGEAREDSDIDILTVLDRLDLADLARYRSVLRGLPEGEKACGFTCGREELLAWPPCELFTFAKDTDAWYGDLAALLPPVSREDIVAGARMSVAALHHYTVYLYISGEESARAGLLRDVYKSFFFAMQVVAYLRGGAYARSKRDLLPLLAGNEAWLLRLGMDADLYEERRKKDPESLFRDMLAWTGQAMRELASLPTAP